ncbi:D-glycero-beta-D-manno-heptose 1-phosphate adenylyltransferase [bacterium]|nr:D-glycero-beta-D-manno-heptose 1-phosphate adenylyltransferase [bacterium]
MYKQKIKKIKQLSEIIKQKKKGRKKIVFTNGCFDILHAGHVRYLNKAKSYGDILIVALNTDESVKGLKGKNRPIIDEIDRTELVASLECVDYVILFDEETPYKTIKKLKPDILVKGGDYTPDTVVGKDVVEKEGGCVYIVPLEQGRSTTDIIKKIVNNFKKPGARR